MLLKSRAISIEDEGNNTKFFHRFAFYQRNQNTISDIKNVEGIKVSSQSNIKKVVEDQFKFLFRDQGRAQISKQMKVLEHYPAFFSREEGIQIGNHISLEELKNVLSSFARDKMLGPDSWTA